MNKLITTLAHMTYEILIYLQCELCPYEEFLSHCWRKLCQWTTLFYYKLHKTNTAFFFIGILGGLAVQCKNMMYWKHRHEMHVPSYSSSPTPPPGPSVFSRLCLGLDQRIKPQKTQISLGSSLLITQSRNTTFAPDWSVSSHIGHKLMFVTKTVQAAGHSVSVSGESSFRTPRVN